MRDGREQNVKIFYYNLGENKLRTKIDKVPHWVISKEIVEEKHGYKQEEFKKILEKSFPIKEFAQRTIQIKPYGRPRYLATDEKNNYELYFSHNQAFVAWLGVNVEDRHKVTFYIGQDRGNPDKKKQIFIRNSKQRIKAVSIPLPIEELDEKYLKIQQSLEGIVEREDIKINTSKQTISVLCDEETLYNLEGKLFRTSRVFKSKVFEKEEDAIELREIVKEIPNYQKLVNILKVVSYHEERKPKFYVLITANNNNDFANKLRFVGFSAKRKKQRGRMLAKSKEDLGDPLNLNNPIWQLRVMNHIHTPYDPNRPLSEQLTTLVDPFAITGIMIDDYRINKISIESAVDDAFNFLKKQVVANDIETTQYKPGSKNPITGKINMSVVYGINPTYPVNVTNISKLGWVRENNIEKLINRHDDEEFGFVMDEIDIIEKTYFDVKEYPLIGGHNYRGFDQKHLTKFNNPKRALSKRKITQKQFDKIKRILSERRKKGDRLGGTRLWPISTTQIIDTYEYARRRIDITPNHKLATLLNRKKSEDYKEIEANFRKGDFESINKNVEYVLDDKAWSFELFQKFLRAMIVESIATNRPITSVSNSDPAMNFWLYSKQTYFRMQNTFMDRHDLFPLQHFNKIKERKSPDEIVQNHFDEEPYYNLGVIKGKPVFQDVSIRASMNIIRNDNMKQYLYLNMLNENNPLIKNIYYNILNKSLLVQIDKVRDAIERAGLEFGKKHTVEEMFLSYTIEDKEEREDVYFNSGDFEKSRESFMWTRNTKTKIIDERKGICIYDKSMLEFNNRFADELENFKKGGILGRGKNMYVVKPDSTLGIPIAKTGTFINMKDHRIIGIINGMYVAQGIKLPKEEKFIETINDVLNNKKINMPKTLEKIYDEIKFNKEIKDSYRQIITAITGYDPKKSKGMGVLDFDEYQDEILPVLKMKKKRKKKESALYSSSHQGDLFDKL